MNSLDNYSLFCIIVDFGKATKAIHLAKELGATGGTIILGKGTVRSSILSLLGLNESRKEIVLMGIDSTMDALMHDEFGHKLSLDKPNHGIAFSIKLKNCFGIKEKPHKLENVKEGANNMKYEAIFTIVDRGVSDEVIEAANEAGSTGGTIIHGRGSGSEETAKLFNIEIEPEKDIVLILSRVDKTESITNAIKTRIDAGAEGKGIIFVIDVNRTTGLYNGDK